MLNSVLSMPNARWMMVDIRNFYVNMPLKKYEYLKLRLSDLPDDVIEQYNSRAKVTLEGFLYVAMRKGMFDLQQVGLLAQELLEK